MNLQLKQLRKKAGLNQTELAKRVGATQRVVSSWETGETALTVEDACAVANVLNCTLDELAGRDGAPGNADPRLVRNMRRMAPEGRAALVATSDALADQFPLQPAEKSGGGVLHA